MFLKFSGSVGDDVMLPFFVKLCEDGFCHPKTCINDKRIWPITLRVIDTCFRTQVSLKFLESLQSIGREGSPFTSALFFHRGS